MKINNETTLVGEFSVLISVYYKENPLFLKECLESVYASTLLPAEVILVKDGLLTDGLEDVISTFMKKDGFNTVCLDQNHGLGVALNVGLKHCSYDLVARMDADDICEPERFHKQYQYLITNPEVSLLGGYITEYDQNFSCSTGIRTVPCGYQNILSKCYLRNPFNHMTVMFKKETIFDVGNYIDHPLMEDYNLWLRVIKSGKIVDNLPLSLVKVRAGNEMIKRRAGITYIKSEFKLMKLINELKITNRLCSLTVFTMRTLIRCFPRSILGLFYALIRR